MSNIFIYEIDLIAVSKKYVVYYNIYFKLYLKCFEYIKKMVDDFVETYGTASNPKKFIRLNN